MNFKIKIVYLKKSKESIKKKSINQNKIYKICQNNFKILLERLKKKKYYNISKKGNL